MRGGAELERYADGPSFVCDSLVCEEEGVRSPTFKNPRSPVHYSSLEKNRLSHFGIVPTSLGFELLGLDVG